MSHRSKRKIAAIQKLFAQREQVAAAQFENALDRSRLEQGKDEDMQGFLCEYRGRYGKALGTGMPASFLKGWQRFLHSLEGASEMQRRQAEKAEQLLEVQRTDFAASRLAVRTGEKLKLRLEESLKRLASRNERRQLDELRKPPRLQRD